jgi:hypothetical protein
MKGQAIQFIAGKYAGKKGWINLDGKEGNETSPVIMNLGKKGEKKTYVNDSSYEGEPTASPSSYSEAVIPLCPDLQKLMLSTCRGFAKADIGQDPTGFLKVIKQMTKDAIKWQSLKGSKALYHKIEYRGEM